MAWRKVAEVVAREAAYRSAKERGRSLRFFRLSKGSMVRYNIFLIVVFTFISVTVGLSAFAGEEMALTMLVMLFIMEIMMGVLIMALNLQVLISNKLLEPMFHLPLGEDEIRKALSWVGIYWGGASLPFVVVPAGAISSYITGDISLLVTSILIAAVGLLLSLGIGYLVGSLAPRYTRSVKGRAISTLTWILVLGVGFLMGPITSTVGKALEKGGQALPKWIPPISFAFMSQDAMALVSSITTLILSYALLRYGTNKFWSAATRGEVHIPKGPAKWSISYGLTAAIMRELKIATRTPRILASIIIYSVVFPFSLIFPWMSISKIPPGFGEHLPALVLAVGGLGGFSLFYLYIMEAAGAGSLYALPLRRSDVARLKFMTFVLVNLPLMAVVSAAILLLSSLRGLLALVVYLATFTGSALMNSLIYANLLPDQPSHWSTETFGRAMIGVIFMAEMGFYFAMGILSFMITGVATKIIIVLASVVIIWLIDAFLYRRGMKAL